MFSGYESSVVYAPFGEIEVCVCKRQRIKKSKFRIYNYVPQKFILKYTLNRFFEIVAYCQYDVLPELLSRNLNSHQTKNLKL